MVAEILIPWLVQQLIVYCTHPRNNNKSQNKTKQKTIRKQNTITEQNKSPPKTWKTCQLTQKDIDDLKDIYSY